MDIVDWAKLVGKEGELDAEENEIVLLSIKKRGWGAFDAPLTFQQSILATKYFLSKQFDLFDWIELGLAVDKTKL
jgi:hypothetical protein